MTIRKSFQRSVSRFLVICKPILTGYKWFAGEARNRGTCKKGLAVDLRERDCLLGNYSFVVRISAFNKRHPRTKLSIFTSFEDLKQTERGMNSQFAVETNRWIVERLAFSCRALSHRSCTTDTRTIVACRAVQQICVRTALSKLKGGGILSKPSVFQIQKTVLRAEKFWKKSKQILTNEKQFWEVRNVHLEWSSRKTYFLMKSRKKGDLCCLIGLYWLRKGVPKFPNMVWSDPFRIFLVWCDSVRAWSEKTEDVF